MVVPGGRWYRARQLLHPRALRYLREPDESKDVWQSPLAMLTLIGKCVLASRSHADPQCVFRRHPQNLVVNLGGKSAAQHVSASGTI
eukprot:2352834-Rhodomonas_salina.2